MKFPVRIGDTWIDRHQVPISPAFALTDYKVQGSTYDEAVLDLSWQSQARSHDAMHKRYCSMNVQVSRLRSLDGVKLLQPLTSSDVANQMHPELAEEDIRLAELCRETMRRLAANSPV